MSRMVGSSRGRGEWVTGAPQPGPEGRGQSGRLIQFIAHGAKEERQMVVDRRKSSIYTEAQETRESQADRSEWLKSKVAR